jgi:hypothetical protein
MAVAQRPSRTARAAVAAGAAAAVVVLTLLGVYVTGGLITNDFELAMALTTAWLVAAGLGCLVVALRSRLLRWPVLGAYLVTASAIGLYLGSSTVFDDEVNERVAVAEPPAAAARPAQGDTATTPEPRRRNVLERSGPFRAVAHSAEGTARYIRLGGGGRVVTLTGFEVDNGPDLRLRLAAGRATNEGDVGDTIDLGALKGNKGNQQYRIPAGTDLTRYDTVIVWCRAFSVLFARAPTTAS